MPGTTEKKTLKKPAKKAQKSANNNKKNASEQPKPLSNKEQLKESLVQQREIRGADVKVYRELISSAIWFWQKERQMQKDVNKRGFSYKAISAAGKPYEKENPSVKNAVLYNNRYCAILSELGLSTEGFKTGKQEEDNPDNL